MKVRKAMVSKAFQGQIHTQSIQTDPTAYADLLFGVGSATSAGPTLPNGSIHPSPETLEKDCGGYLRNQPIIGFGHAYVSGSGGTKCYGNFLLAPMVGDIELDHACRASFAVPGTEKARCYEYCVTLENGIHAQVTPAHNAAMHTFTFPAGKEASFLMDVAHKLDIDAALRHGSVTVDPTRKTIYGGGLYFGNWNAFDWEMYFTLEFDTEFEEIGIFTDEGLISLKETTTIEITDEKRLGAYVSFGVPDSALEVKVKLAISFVSVERAKFFLAQQLPDFNYALVRENAKSVWRRTLSAIELDSEDPALLRRFYTAMYHMNIQPRNRTADHGTWDDFHTTWDTWKTLFPMYCLLYPDRMSQITESLLDRAMINKAEGIGIVIGDEYLAGKETLAGQGGNDVDNILADTYLKGIALRKYDWEDVYQVLLASAEQMRSPEYISKGFAINNKISASGVPYTKRFKPAAVTQGFAVNDMAIATVAKELGTPEEYDKYFKRSANWLNVWNPANESEGFYGFPQTPDEDGHFAPGFDAHGGYNTHFYEATGWDASYINYNDMPRLIKAMGGSETFTERLLWACEHSVNYYNDDHGKEGYLNFTNEPSFHIPWLFCTDEIRRPDLAARVIDKVIARFSLPDDYPGDEDNGGMSSYYIFMMCGFFPFATTENYYLHGTRVPKITFHLGNGKDFIITGKNAGNNHIYVQSATWQEKPLNTCKLTHSQILEGGELHFVMGDMPSDWGK